MPVGFVGPAMNNLIHMTKTVSRTHDQHPGVFFSEHENCQKHVRAVINKSNIKKSLAKSLDKKSFADLTLFVR